MPHYDHYRINEFRMDRNWTPPRKPIITSKRLGVSAVVIYALFTSQQSGANHLTPVIPPIQILSPIPEKVTRGDIENAGLLIFPLKGDQCGLLLEKRPGEKERVLLFAKPPEREDEYCLTLDRDARRAFIARLQQRAK